MIEKARYIFARHGGAARVADRLFHADTGRVIADVDSALEDFLVTVGDDANERCPFMSSVMKRLHWSFEDSSRAGSDRSPNQAVANLMESRRDASSFIGCAR